MARTWSVPQRGNLSSDWVLESSPHHAVRALATLKRLTSERNALLVCIVFLAATGIAVPYLDDQTIRTLLVVAGAGLASLLFLQPAAPQSASPSHLIAPDARSHEAHFAELSVERAASAKVDRATWARLTAQMSHELRTPLNAVLGFSELMTNEVFGPLGSSCYSAYARDIHSSGRLLLKSAEDALAITALLTAGDRRSGTTTACLRQAIDEAAAFLAFDLSERQVTLNCSLDDCRIMADAQATRQMLINLIADLIAKSDSGATITVRSANTARGTRLSMTLHGARTGQQDSGDTFCTTLARTLCSLAGGDLSSQFVGEGRIESAICFVPAVQNDLFDR